MNASFAFLISLMRATGGFPRHEFVELSSPRPVGPDGMPGKLGDGGGVTGVSHGSLQGGEYEISSAEGLLMAFGGLQRLRLIYKDSMINARVSFI